MTKEMYASGASRVPRWVVRVTGHIPPGQFARYLAVGVWNTLFGYGTYALFTALLMRRFRFGYIYAAVFSNLISITVSYLGYKIFVFRTHGNYLREWVRCLMVYGAGMLPGLVLLPIVVEGLHYGFHLRGSAPYIGGALVMGLTVIASFFGHRHFTFRPRTRGGSVAAVPVPAISSEAHTDDVKQD